MGSGINSFNVNFTNFSASLCNAPKLQILVISLRALCWNDPRSISAAPGTLDRESLPIGALAVVEPLEPFGHHTRCGWGEVNDSGVSASGGVGENHRKGGCRRAAGDKDIQRKLIDERDDPLGIEAGLRKSEYIGKSKSVVGR